MSLLVTSTLRGPKARKSELTAELLARITFLKSHPEFATPLHRLLLLTPGTVTSNGIAVPHQPMPYSRSAIPEIDISPDSPTHSRTRVVTSFLSEDCCPRQSRCSARESVRSLLQASCEVSQVHRRGFVADVL